MSQPTGHTPYFSCCTRCHIHYGVIMETEVEIVNSKAVSSKVRRNTKSLFSIFLVLGPTRVGFQRCRNFFPELILPIKPRMHIWPCSWAVGISKKIWIQIEIGPVTVDSVEAFRYFAFWRHGTRFASFLIVPKNCIFWGASFKLIKNLSALVPNKLQGIYETLLLMWKMFINNRKS